MSKSRPHIRHMFPPDDDDRHTATPYCPCRPNKRTRGPHVTYVHNPIDRTPETRRW